MQLHIISKSPYSHDAFEQAWPLIAAEDTVILINDAVYAVQSGSGWAARINDHPARFVALDSDLACRGLSQGAAVEAVNIGSFVELSFAAQHCISWY